MEDSPITPPASELASPAVDAYKFDDEESGEPLSVKAVRFLRLCWASRKLVFVVLAIGASLSVLVAFLTPSTYISTTTIMPPQNASPYSNLLNMLTSASSAASLGSAALGLSTPGEFYVSILSSRTVEDDLIAKFGLMDIYRTRLHEDARKRLKSDTAISQDRKSGIVTVSVTASSPALASDLAKAYVEDLNRLVTENSTSSARSERIFLEGRLKEIKMQLDESAAALSQFSSKSGTFDMPSQAKSMVEAGLKLQTELIDGRARLAALRETYSEDNPRVRAIEAHNSELQRELDKMGGVSRAPDTAASSSDSAFPAANKLPALGLTYYNLERKLQVNEALWEALTKQYEAAKVEEAQQIPTVRVLDPANFPERKAGPAKRLVLEIGLFLSLAFAVVLVYVKSAWDEIDEQSESRKLLMEVVGAALDGQRWYWRLPGMSQFHRRIVGG